MSMILRNTVPGYREAKDAREAKIAACVKAAQVFNLVAVDLHGEDSPESISILGYEMNFGEANARRAEFDGKLPEGIRLVVLATSNIYD